MSELTAFEADMLDRIPHGDDGISSSEAAHALHEFAALHRLHRKGLIEIEPDDASDITWIRRTP